jgi:hypothetical protein
MWRAPEISSPFSEKMYERNSESACKPLGLQVCRPATSRSSFALHPSSLTHFHDCKRPAEDP